MKYVYLLLIAACVAACKKNNNPSPGNPVKDYSVGRMPLPYWGDDTLSGVIMDKGKIVDYDSFITYNKNGLSYLNYRGNEYCLWIDTNGGGYVPNKSAYAGVRVSSSIKDENNVASCTYYPNFFHDSNGDPDYNLRWIVFNNAFLNNNISERQWSGRWWGDGERRH